MISVSEALDTIAENSIAIKTQRVLLNDSIGFFLAEDIYSDRNYPPFNRSAMDGYAINTADWKAKDDIFHASETLLAGDFLARPLSPKEAIRIMTGAPVPKGANAVIKIEDCILHSNKHVAFNLENIVEWQNVAKEAEDTKAGELVIPKGVQITSSMIPLLSSIGATEPLVVSPLRVSIICTGNEIVEINQKPLPHQIRNSNLSSIKAFLQNYHITDINYQAVSDNAKKIETTLYSMLSKDMIIITGGVSMGDTDYVPDVLSKIGVQNKFYKVKVKPGKPIWFGMYHNKIPIFALPGNPMSVQVGLKIFVESLLLRYFSGRYAPFRPILKMGATKLKKHSFTEYFPVSVAINEGLIKAYPIVHNGSGDIRSMTFSHGLCMMDEEKKVLQEGDTVEFIPWASNSFLL